VEGVVPVVDRSGVELPRGRKREVQTRKIRLKGSIRERGARGGPSEWNQTGKGTETAGGIIRMGLLACTSKIYRKE